MSYLAGVLDRIIKKLQYTRSQYLLKRKRFRFYSSFVNSGSLCFDIGANMGNRIEPLLKIGAKVVAVEPQPACVRALTNKFANRISIVDMGIADHEGVMDFFISTSHTLSSFSKQWINTSKEGRFSDESWKEGTKVRVTTLDSLIKKFGVPHFIKIDVEGFELNVLKGLNHPVKYLSFEYTVPECKQQIYECISVLTSKSQDNSVEFNYSIGESMEWALARWLSTDEMVALVQSTEFNNTGFGDIYVRQANS